MLDKPTRLRMLREARPLIEAGWTRHASARNVYGYQVSPHAVDAVCFCLQGACQRVTNGKVFRSIETTFEPVSRYISRESVPVWNDCKTRRKADVLTLIDKAIEYWEKQ